MNDNPNSYLAAGPVAALTPNVTRTGKIARLPWAIRDQLNQRLADGQPASQILPWLHSLPEVRQILKDQFKGCPITPQNLSHWKSGGYVDWVHHQDARQLAANMVEEIGRASCRERVWYYV